MSEFNTLGKGCSRLLVLLTLIIQGYGDKMLLVAGGADFALRIKVKYNSRILYCYLKVKLFESCNPL